METNASGTAVAWPKVPISTIYEDMFDGPHATPKPADEGPVFLGIKNITEGGFLDLTDVRHISEEDFGIWTRRVLPRAGDIVFTYEATLNRYAMIPSGFRGCLGRRLALIRPNISKVDPRFLHYSFFSEEWPSVVAKHTILGSTVDRIPLVTFPSFEIRVPPLQIQRKIVQILSAYDDLIENNTRRIVILEEMARALYREWFVDFRFPGHEGVRMVESEVGLIPEGWEVTPVGEVVETLGGGTPSTKQPEYWENGDIVWFSPTDLTSAGSMFVFDSAKHITATGLKNSSARLFPAYSVMMTSRATIGVVAINTEPACTNQGFITCVPNERMTALQIYFWIEQNRETINRLASGATFKEISRGVFRRMPMVVPAADVTSRYTKAVQPISKEIEILLVAIQNLRSTRDLLLPRLVSGSLTLPAEQENADGKA